MERRVFTLGTSTRSWEEFLGIIKREGIKKVVDVRRFPTSKFPHFRKEALAENLKREDIDYIYLGEELGGYRRGGYEKFLENQTFKKGLHKLEDIARSSRTLIICAERLFFRCHRRFIARELEKRGWEVKHLL